MDDDDPNQASKGSAPDTPTAPGEPQRPAGRLAMLAVVIVDLVIPLVAAWLIAILSFTAGLPENTKRIGATTITITDRPLKDLALPADATLIYLRDNEVQGRVIDTVVRDPPAATGPLRIRLGDVIHLEDGSYQAGVFDPRLTFSILRQLAPAGKAQSGSLLIRSAHAGEEVLPVPDLVGLPQDQAEAILEKLGFKADVQLTTFAKGKPGTVIDQKPGRGETAPMGSPITIVILVLEVPPPAPAQKQTFEPEVPNQAPTQTEIQSAPESKTSVQTQAVASPGTTPNILASAAVVALLRANNDGASAIGFDLRSIETSEIIADPVYALQVHTMLVDSLRSLSIELLPSRPVFISSSYSTADLPIYDSRLEAAVRTALAIVATPLPLPGGDAVLMPQAMPEIVDRTTPPEKLINGAYQLEPRWTIVPTVLFVSLVVIILVYTLRRRPSGPGTPTPRGVLAGIGCALILGLLLYAGRQLNHGISANAQPDSPDILLVGIAFFAINALFALGAAGGGYLLRLAHAEKRTKPRLEHSGKTPATPRDNVLRTILYSDKPIDDLAQDQLGFGPLVIALQQFLDNRDTKPPVVVAVNGPWGSGKSSLMKMVAARLRKTGRFHVAWFNAWEYHTEEQILAAFLKTVATSLTRDWGPWFAVRIAWYRFKRATLLQYFLMASPFALLLMAVFAPKALAPLQSLLTIFTSEKQEAAATGVASVAGLGGVAWLIQFLLPFRLQYKKLSTIRDPSERVGFIDEFRNEFALYRQAMGENQKFLIVVDDLDRCLDKNIVEVLKTINLIVAGGDDASRTFFMLGYDPTHVIPSIELHFKDLLAAGKSKERFGESFMKKMVTLSVSVPRPRPEQVQQMATALDPAPANSTASVAKTARQRTAQLLQQFGTWLQGMGEWTMKLTAALILLAALATLLSLFDVPKETAVAVSSATTTAGPESQSSGGESGSQESASAESIEITDQVTIDQGSTGVTWLTWLTGLLVVFFAIFLILRQVLRPQPEVEFRREPQDTAEFKAAVEACAPLLPANPRDIVRLVNLMRVTFLVQSSSSEGTKGYGGEALDPRECVTLTVLQQRHRETFNVASLEAMADPKPTVAFQAIANAAFGTIADDEVTLRKRNVATDFLRDPKKMRRFYEVNYFELDPARAAEEKPVEKKPAAVVTGTA